MGKKKNVTARDTNADIYNEAVERKREAIEYVSIVNQRRECVEDRYFATVRGEQYNGDAKADIDAKSRFEFNKAQSSVNRTVTEVKTANCAVTFLPRGGEVHQDVSDLANGMFRADYQDSLGTVTERRVIEEGVGGGMGAARWRTAYESEEGFDKKQRCIFEVISDADQRVFFDPESQMPDKSDAEYVFVLHPMSLRKFKKRWPDERPSSFTTFRVNYFPRSISSYTPMWSNSVVVGEWIRIVEKKVKIVRFVNALDEERVITKERLDNEPELSNILLNEGWAFDDEATITEKRVEKHFLNGERVMESQDLPGKRLPVAIYFGRQYILQGVEYISGATRLLKDPCRLFNFIVSGIGEIAATSSSRVPIIHPTQMTPEIAVTWAKVHIDNPAYLNLYGPVINGQEQPLMPLQYLEPPTIPVAMAAMVEILNNVIRELTGSFDEGEKIRANTSGKAIGLVQEFITNSFSKMYIDNYADFKRQVGLIWIDLAKPTYIEKERTVKLLDEAAEVSFAKLGQERVDDDGNMYEVSLTDADLDVRIDVGPNSVTKRTSTTETLTELLRIVTDPEWQSVIMSMIVQNVEGEGMDKARKFADRKLIKMGVNTPNEEQRKELEAEMAAMPPDPVEEYTRAQTKLTEVEAQKQLVTTEKLAKEVELTEAKTFQAKADGLEKLKNASIPPESVEVEVAPEMEVMQQPELAMTTQ